MKFLKAWIPVMIWMVIIFYLSHQPAQSSSELSTGITQIIIDILNVIASFSEGNLPHVHFIIRKFAHLCAYLILAYLLMNAFNHYMKLSFRMICFVFFICVIYAISDELHQLYIPGRSGEIRDVIIDTAGSFIGVILYILVRRIKER